MPSACYASARSLKPENSSLCWPRNIGWKRIFATPSLPSPSLKREKNSSLFLPRGMPMPPFPKFLNVTPLLPKNVQRLCQQAAPSACYALALLWPGSVRTTALPLRLALPLLRATRRRQRKRVQWTIVIHQRKCEAEVWPGVKTASLRKLGLQESSVNFSRMQTLSQLPTGSREHRQRNQNSESRPPPSFFGYT